MKHTPILPEFGRAPEDFRTLEKFIRDNQEERGIRTNEKRYLIIAEK